LSISNVVSPGCRLAQWLLLAFVSVSTLPVLAQTGPAPSKAATGPSASDSQETTDASDQPADAEPPEGELAPAAVQLDVSTASNLIQVLYAATRETKDQPTLDHLAQAKTLIDSGADVKATDSLGRTALHWAIFGSSYASKQELIVAYEEVAAALIAHGVDINHEDIYNDTALDYLLYSPNFEMQTLLIEHGATSGFLVASFNFINQLEACKTPVDQSPSSRASANHVANGHSFPAAVSIAQDPGSASVAVNKPSQQQPSQSNRIAAFMKADLVPGQTLSVRLISPASSDRSRTGDPIEAVVTYPLCTYGEWLACKPGQLLVAPGTKVNGTVLFAQKAPDKYWRPRLVLDFSNIVHKDGKSSPVYARVIDVDNARETIRNNEILGIVQPHVTGKVSLAFAAVGAINPIASYTINGVRAVYGLSLRREILFPAGTDIQIQVVRPSMLAQREPWQAWPTLPVTPKLRTLVEHAPIRTQTADGTPSDLTNLMFLGSREEIISAFDEAGWFEAVPSGFGTDVKVVQATLRQTGYSNAPVSSLMIDARPPDLVFQKSLDTFAKRHHVRIWKLPSTYEGHEVWVGAATHDIAVEHTKTMTKWTHRIDPHIDRERDWAESDLLFIGTATGYADVNRPAAPHTAANATGDTISTDGVMSVLQLGPAKTPPAGPPQLISR
jgi:LssY C-terminus/Ankyrin repeat